MTIETTESKQPEVEVSPEALNPAPESGHGHVEDRFTETETVQQAATSAHTDLQNSEGIKDRVNEIFVGATAKAAEDLYEALCQEMTQTVAKLKITKATTDRSNLVQQIGEINTRISAVLEMFLSHN